MTSSPSNKGLVVVTGILFWYPLAGVTFQFLHYLLGLRRLGFDVYYLEDCGHPIYDASADDLRTDVTPNLEAVVPILERHGFGGRWGFRSRYDGGTCFGMSHQRMRQLYRDCDALLNVTGAQDLGEDHLLCRRRIFVESDPFSTQVRIAKGEPFAVEQLKLHDTWFSFGENLGAPDCTVPVTTGQWLPTRQPVALDLWDGPPTGGNVYNTITTWRNTGKDIEYGGDTYYWTKDREFEKFLTLPRQRNVRLELAARVEPDVEPRLRELGWELADSVAVSRNVDDYRSYIQSARAEFTVARDQYVRPRTGWFSDRSACYLAAGRPVITQETGFSKFLPSGRGLHGFETMEDILRAIDRIEADYSGECAAARDVAAEYFDAEKVLSSLIHRAGI